MSMDNMIAFYIGGLVVNMFFFSLDYQSGDLKVKHSVSAFLWPLTIVTVVLSITARNIIESRKNKTR